MRATSLPNRQAKDWRICNELMTWRGDMPRGVAGWLRYSAEAAVSTRNRSKK
jgi:hypothetical protein